MLTNIIQTLFKKHIIPLIGLGLILIVLSIITILSGFRSPSQTPTPGSALPTTILDRIPTPQNLSPQQEAQIQSEADRNFGTQIDKINSEYPWYQKLPIITNDYFVYFDLKKKSFIGRIYNTKGQNNFVVENTKLKAAQDLNNTIGSDSSKYPITWELL